MKKEFACASIFLALACSVEGQTNQWTKSTSGNWEESYWSLGRLPGIDQQLVAIDNYGWKAVAIGANTTANYPQSLSLNNLLIDAPTNSSNQLLLNWAHLNVPLTVQSNLTVGTNGSLVSHYSAIQAANACIDGSASFMDYATENFGQLLIRSGGSVGLSNGIMSSSNLMFYTGTFTQSGGTHNIDIINNMADGYDEWYRHGEYDLQGGTLISTNVGLGSGGDFYPEGHGSIHQTGGVHTNTGMFLAGWSHHWATTSLGAYTLDGGLLISSSVGIGCGYFSQTAGTNRIQELYVNSGGFSLSGGVLVTSNVSVSIGSEINSLGFYQTGGVQTVQGQLLINGPYDHDYNHEVSYELSGGLLVTSNILVQSGAFLVSSQGTVSNAGIVTLTGGYLLNGSTSATQYLGQLQLSASPTNYPWDVQRTGGSLDLNYYPGQSVPTVWRFADSHTLPWTGILQIWDWGAGSHIFFGTNAQGLTQAQLEQIYFMGYAGGYEPTNFPAMLLPNGELVMINNTNEWTKSTDGKWEDAYWSLGRLPGLDQGFVFFDNPPGTTLTINQNTTANYPQSLSLYNLMVNAPLGGLANVLMLDSAGLAVPLNVHWNLTVGPNGTIVNRASSLHAANANINGSILLIDGSIADFNNLDIGPGATVNLADGSLTFSNLYSEGGALSQTGGACHANTIELPQSGSFYYLNGGTLTSQDLWLDGDGEAGGGRFVQSGGVHTNLGMRLSYYGGFEGYYVLNEGLLVSASVYMEGGRFFQNGGTNLIADLSGSIDFELSGGELVTSNAPVGGNIFVQTGGRHTIRNRLSIGNTYSGSSSGAYDLVGGRLVTSNIDIYNGTLFLSSDGVVSNMGVLAFTNYPYDGYYMGHISVADTTSAQYLGQLQMSGDAVMDLHLAGYPPTTNVTILHFADSHTLPWAGTLQILHWGAKPGDHIYFGMNAQALSAGQLAQIQFIDSGGKTNSATLLATGELVPAVPPPLITTNSNNTLVLSWPGGYELVSSTNVNGPYLTVPAATSPFTNTFTDPQHFFLLHLPSP